MPQGKPFIMIVLALLDTTLDPISGFMTFIEGNKNPHPEGWRLTGRSLPSQAKKKPNLFVPKFVVTTSVVLFMFVVTTSVVLFMFVVTTSVVLFMFIVTPSGVLFSKVRSNDFSRSLLQSSFILKNFIKNPSNQNVSKC